jgi:hypothetical protein
VRNYRTLKNELRRGTDKEKKENFERICDEIMEFQRTGYCDLMYMKTKEIGLKEHHGIRTIGIEVSQGKVIVEQIKY